MLPIRHPQIPSDSQGPPSADWQGLEEGDFHQNLYGFPFWITDPLTTHPHLHSSGRTCPTPIAHNQEVGNDGKAAGLSSGDTSRWGWLVGSPGN